LLAIAALEPDLKEGGLRLLIRLARDLDDSGVLTMSVRECARHYELSSTTFLRAIEGLDQLGVIHKSPGSPISNNLYRLRLNGGLQ
jgi:hypothetical protein